MKKIVIVGAGALGSHVALILRNVADLKVIDFDRIEQKNLLSQFHNKGSVGRNKAQALQGLMSLLWGTKLEAVPHKLVDSNVEQLLGSADLVIDCLDNGTARRTVQQWCNSRDFIQDRWVEVLRGTVPLLHGALAPDGAFGQVIWDEQFKIDDDAAGGATCEDGAFLPFIVIVSSYIALAAQTFIEDGKKIGFQVHPGGVARV